MSHEQQSEKQQKKNEDDVTAHPVHSLHEFRLGELLGVDTTRKWLSARLERSRKDGQSLPIN